MENKFWAVGRWPGLDRGIKGFGPIMSNFFECFFQFFMCKKMFLRFFYIVASEKLHKIKLKFFLKNFFFDPKNMKKSFFS